MIRLLAQIISRQLCNPREKIHEEAGPSPVAGPTVLQTPSISRAGSSAKISLPGPETPTAGKWSEQSISALIVLFTELAQRRVQAVQAKEEIYEYRPHHPSSPATTGLRLRASIHSVAG